MGRGRLERRFAVVIDKNAMLDRANLFSMAAIGQQ